MQLIISPFVTTESHSLCIIQSLTRSETCQGGWHTGAHTLNPSHSQWKRRDFLPARSEMGCSVLAVATEKQGRERAGNWSGHRERMSGRSVWFELIEINSQQAEAPPETADRKPDHSRWGYFIEGSKVKEDLLHMFRVPKLFTGNLIQGKEHFPPGYNISPL